MFIIGIDPGLTGALAVLGAKSGRLIALEDLPVMRKGFSDKRNQIDPNGLARIFRRYRNHCEVTLEMAQAMPKQGVSSTFIIGHTAGIIEGVLGGLGIKCNLVPASIWKKESKIGKDKEKSRAIAIRMFPNCDKLGRKKDHNRAESILIAVWARRIYNSRSER